MNWENLKTNSCPFCSANLIEEAETEMLHCEACRFRIEVARAKSIATHRNAEGTIVPMRWQLLHKNECPMSGEKLVPIEGATFIKRCVNDECVFRISDKRMIEILDDENHPANRHHRV
jgi:DNA-directed RNA polymerase subunit RPC12/RpoP